MGELSAEVATKLAELSPRSIEKSNAVEIFGPLSDNVVAAANDTGPAIDQMANLAEEILPMLMDMACPNGVTEEDRQSFLDLFRNCQKAMQFAKAKPPDPKWNDRDFVLKKFQEDPALFKLASAQLKDDHELVLTVVSQRGSLLSEASDRLKGNPEIVVAACSNIWGFGALHAASAEAKANRDIVLPCVRANYMNYHQASAEMKSDRDIFIAAISQEPGLFEMFRPEEFRGDRDVILALVAQEEEMLKEATPELTEELTKAADALGVSMQDYARTELKHMVVKACGSVVDTEETMHVPVSAMTGEEVAKLTFDLDDLDIKRKKIDANIFRKMLSAKLGVEKSSLHIVLPDGKLLRYAQFAEKPLRELLQPAAA